MIRSLVKRYTRHNLSEINGPITVVSGILFNLLLGKKRRLTLIECKNDLSAMIDIGKVADLVLLLVDASLGFQMVFI